MRNFPCAVEDLDEVLASFWVGIGVQKGNTALKDVLNVVPVRDAPRRLRQHDLAEVFRRADDNADPLQPDVLTGACSFNTGRSGHTCPTSCSAR
jgi:hypothetical protein